jgi:hypothetical protein
MKGEAVDHHDAFSTESAGLREGVEIDEEVTVAQYPVDPLDALALVTRRIGGVEADEVLKQLHRTLVDRELFVRRR